MPDGPGLLQHPLVLVSDRASMELQQGIHLLAVDLVHILDVLFDANDQPALRFDRDFPPTTVEQL